MDQEKTATFGSGCFWCTEAFFQRLEGVKKAVSGYSGGSVRNPSYREVCTGTTGHAEVVQVTYDPSLTTYDDLLEVFFSTHDPTTRNRQGADVGTQYRSVIFYHDEDQKARAEKWISALNDSDEFKGSVVTELAPYSVFYPAEEYHQDYFNRNGEAPYCRLVIQPKLNKFVKSFAGKLKQRAG